MRERLLEIREAVAEGDHEKALQLELKLLYDFVQYVADSPTIPTVIASKAESVLKAQHIKYPRS